MRVLSDREREVLRLRFEEDLTQSEIGQRVGVSQMHVSRLIRQSIARLRDEADAARLTPRDPRRLAGRSRPWSTGTCARSTCSRTSRRSCTRRAASRGRSPSTCPPGEQLQDHEVHERAHLVVVEGEVEVDAGGGTVRGGPGFAAVFDPQERHEVRATSDARLLLVLAPWPGEGHPGARD